MSAKPNAQGKLAVLFTIIWLIALVLMILVWHNRQNYWWRFIGMCFLPSMLASIVMLVLAFLRIDINRFEVPVIGKLARKVSIR
jgi:hypothetical protein